MNASRTMPLASRWERLRPTDRRALAIGATLVGLLLTYSLFVRPAFTRLITERQTLARRIDLLEKERALLAAAPQFPLQEREGRRTLAAELPRLFVGDSVAAAAELNTYVSQLAGAAGLRLTSVEGRPATTDRGLVKVSVEVRGEGNWRQVLSYTRSLESSTRLVQIANVRIERGARGGPLGGAMISISATLAGFAEGTP